MNILSFGAGVNSTAQLVLHLQGLLHFDALIFADTQGEHPQTYTYLEEVVKPACIENDLPLHIVTNGSLYDDYWDRNIIPFRRFRSCTDKYKIRPIRRFLKTQYGEDFVTSLGIDYGEKHRSMKYEGVFEFPLIENKIDRQGCKDIIKEYGWDVPIKSGCFFCPFTTKRGWLRLLSENRDLFLRAEAFEKNCRAYPKYTLTNKPLERIRESVDNQTSLSNWVEVEGEPCLYCHI